MLNIEKYADEIKKINDIGLTRVTKTGKVEKCKGANCYECIFDDDKCDAQFIEWLLEEYKEKPEVTEAEYYFCKIIKYGRLFKDKNGDVHWSPGEAGEPGVYIASAVRTLGVFTENLKFNCLNTGRENATPIRELIEIYEAAHDIKS